MKNNCEALKISKYISDFLGDYAPSYLTNSQHTIKSYKTCLKLYIQFLESKDYSITSFNYNCFKKELIEEWLKWLCNEKHNSAATCNVRLGTLRTFLKYASSKDISLINLYNESLTILRKKGVQKNITGLTRNAVSALLSSPDVSTKIGRRDYTLILLMYSIAARFDEILSIKLEQLHLNQSKPYVIVIGKGSKLRTLYLLPAVVKKLNDYIADFHNSSSTNDYLFYSKINNIHKKLTEPAIVKRLKIYAEIANKKCSEVPLDLHAHQFRHAKASHWIEDGLNVLQVSFLLGHANVSTTMVYLDISNEAKQKAISTLENEEDKSATRKWKNADGSLLDFCALK